MDTSILRKRISSYQSYVKTESAKFKQETAERQERRLYYAQWTREKILSMTEADFEQYLSRLWAMLIWGNKKYVTNKIIEDHGLEFVREELAEFVWGRGPVKERWDDFRTKIKGMGPAMMSEILCYVHPDQCMLWNRRAYIGLNYLGVKDLPRYNYQMTGKRYVELSKTTWKIVEALRENGFPEADLLTADYFIWEELQVQPNLNALFKPSAIDGSTPDTAVADPVAAEFIHNEVRDKIRDIGRWLGLEGRTEVKVADGSVVDTIWEQTIGNMGHIVYVFEVQTKGSIDSLILNLLKSVNNPAVQAVVAVSDSRQIEKIKKHVAGVDSLNNRLKYWDYQRVLEVHEALESVNAEINSIGLVPSTRW